jgi:hypothetical protein
MNDSCDLYAFDLGDKRLNRRAGRIVQAALEHAGDSIPTAAGTLAASDATYRFFDNPNVVPSDLDDAHTRSTFDLAARYPGVLLIAQDTTDADFTSPVRNGRLGQLAHAKHFGFYIHSALAMTADGLPLGLLHQHVWMRPPQERGKRKDRRRKATADKESQRWLDTEAACMAALPADRTVVMIADRECDFYDYFAAERRPGQHVLIRAKLRRRIAGSKELLGAATRAQPIQGTLTVSVPRKDGQPKRQATLAVRYGAFALQPPSTHPRRQELPSLPLRTLLVEEVHPPVGVQPLQWLLLTTLPIDSFADAERLVRWYTYRWRIERYHFTLKSGCRLEELQLETAERLRRALALYAIVAARLLHLTYLARHEPEASCEPAVNAEEWEVLWRHFQPKETLPLQPPTLRQAMRWIGRLGGFLARKGDGEPGVKVLWRGLRQLQAMLIGFRLANAAAHGVQSSDES